MTFLILKHWNIQKWASKKRRRFNYRKMDACVESLLISIETAFTNSDSIQIHFESPTYQIFHSIKYETLEFSMIPCNSFINSHYSSIYSLTTRQYVLLWLRWHFHIFFALFYASNFLVIITMVPSLLENVQDFALLPLLLVKHVAFIRISRR